MACEGNIGRLDRGIRSGRAHRDTDVGGGQRRASLMPSPIIATEPFLVSSAIAAALSSGAARRAHPRYRPVCQRPCGAGVVSGEHGHLEALGSEGAHDFGDLGAQLVTHADRGDRLPLAVHDHDGHALLL